MAERVPLILGFGLIFGPGDIWRRIIALLPGRLTRIGDAIGFAEPLVEIQLFAAAGAERLVGSLGRLAANRAPGLLVPSLDTSSHRRNPHPTSPPTWARAAGAESRPGQGATCCRPIRSPDRWR